MEFLSDTVVLSRMQFALTALFHMLFPVLTTGMGIYLAIVEGLWLKTKNSEYYHHARFWSKFYVLNFGIGVATGIPMEFQFGTNWAPFSEATGNFFGSVIGFEASWAFMLEAAFLGIMLFGWERVNPVIHFMSTILVAVGANLSTLWILTANSWMQTPAGVELVNGKFIVHDYFQAMFNPFMRISVLHMFFATLETSLFVIGGISAWYILQRRNEAFFSRSLKIALATAIAVTPIQVALGHASAEQVYHYQPSKLAAMEAQWETIPAGQSAPWSVLALPNDKEERNDWELEIPNGLGYLLEFKQKLTEPVRGLRDYAPTDRPHLVWLVYYAFRIMSGLGVALVGVMLINVIQWMRGKLYAENIGSQRLLLWIWMLSAPLGYIAVETGWIVRCVGRQPWTVYGQYRTADSASHIPAMSVLTSLSGFVILYSILFVAALYFGRRILMKGPNLELPVPSTNVSQPAIKTEPGKFEPDERPAEAQQ